MKEKVDYVWTTMSSEEIWNAIPRSEEELKVVIKPSFPTNRWGKLTTKTASNDKASIEKAIAVLKDNGVNVRKRICHDTTNKHKGRGFGTFYKIEIRTIKNPKNS
jgi:hypothetical protein